MMWLLGLLSVVNFPAHGAEDFSYFSEPKINYWPEAKTAVIPKSEPPTHAAKKFSWDKYLDPKHDEFFKEGDYIPPAPFMEIARNPSDENIRNWFRYLEMKNGLAERLQSKLEEFSRKEAGLGLLDPEKARASRVLAAAAANVRTIAAVEPASKDYHLRLYFDSRCPHCEKMMGTLGDLSQRGFYVELRRVDHVPGFTPKFPFPIQQATPEEIHKNQIDAVPVLLVGDLKRRSMFKIQGYQTPDAVISAIREAQSTSLNKGGQS